MSISTDPALRAEYWEELSQKHLESFAAVRQWCDGRMGIILLSEEKGLKSDPAEIRDIAQALAIAVAGEREAAQMQFRDHKAGLKVITSPESSTQAEPDEEVGNESGSDER